MPLTPTTPIEEIYMIGDNYADKLKQFLNIHTVRDLLFHFPFRYEDLTQQKSISQIQPGETVTIQGYISTIENTTTRNRKKIQKAVFQDFEGNKLYITWFNQPFLTKSLSPGTQVSLAGEVKTFGNRLQMTAPKYEIIKKNHLYERGQAVYPANAGRSSQGIQQSNSDTSSYAESTHTGRLVPIYPETYGVTSKWIRSRIKPLLKYLDTLIEDWLPQEIIKGENSYSSTGDPVGLPSKTEIQSLLPLPQAIRQIHFPENQAEIDSARHRLAFDELFLLQLQTIERKSAWEQKKLRHRYSISLSTGEPVGRPDLHTFLSSLPFTLTPDQQTSLKEITQDLSKPTPMNRLLQGDVGSGKTVIAAAAIYLTNQQYCTGDPVDRPLKTVLLAPTEVLANQHYKSLKQILEPFGIKIGLYTGSHKPKESIDHYDLYLGTHALLFQDLPHDQIGLVIIDEQHRFGVNQRGKILGENKKNPLYERGQAVCPANAGQSSQGIHRQEQAFSDLQPQASNLNSQSSPHLLSMTATPIPRTIALTMYGDLTLSYIKTMPKGRKPIKTWVVPEEKRKSAFSWIEKEIKTHNTQAYFIYPLIDPSDKKAMTNIKAAKQEFEAIQKAFPNRQVGLMHGKLKSKEKQQIMEDFANKKLDILVSTSVIEVGIDVPNATMIIIEGAERFGLAQLHQLRGRVGRGEDQSYCLLFTSTKDKESTSRLKAMEKTNSGIELAELDLKLRGPGQLYGTMQSGYLDLKMAQFDDQELINQAQKAANDIFPQLSQFTLLQEKLSDSKINDIQPN